VAKAGDASSVNQITRQVGGAFGVAVIGSTFAAAYSAKLPSAIEGVPAASLAAADQSLGGAVDAAGRIGGTAGAQLAALATDAFDAAVQISFLVAAALSVMGAVVAAITVTSRPSEREPRRPSGPQGDGNGTAQTPTVSDAV
jgi:DHA2 family multidrug resistance protein-like MFS transporter